MKSILFTGLAVLGLAACTPPQKEFVINKETTANISLSSLVRSFEGVTASSAVSAVKKHCGVGKSINLTAIKNSLLADQYQVLGSDQSKNLAIYAKKDAAPMFTIGKHNNISVCVVIVDDKEATRAKFEPLLHANLDKSAFGLPAELVGGDKGDFVWVSGKTKSQMYLLISPDNSKAFGYATR